MTNRYNNYHKHDHISNIFTPDTNSHAEDYIKKCIEYGHTNYFTTNHGTMGDIFEARTLCDKYGIRCIAGLEGYIVPDPYEKDKSNYHIIIIPRTNIARKKVNRLSSRANIEGYYYKPRIFLDDLLALDKDDVYITTACAGGILKDERATREIFCPLYNHFRENLFLEVQNHLDEHQIEINKRCLKLKEKLGLKLIAANDSHYISSEKEGGKEERLELLKGKGITYGDEDTYILDFPSYETMVERFKKQGVLSDEDIKEAMKNTLIFDSCEEIDLNKDIKMPNIYPDLAPSERLDLLKNKVNKNFATIKEKEHIKGKKLKEYIEGIRYEMDIIEQTNEEVHTADYFLLNTEIVEKAINEYGGVLTRTGRGSCGSFYINRLLGMTQIDRFAINLPLYPDRFISAARLLENKAMPDVDFNVVKQEPFIRATRDILGENMCYPMIAYGTMQVAEAFRNVCRSHGIEHSEYNEIAKNIEKYTCDERWGDLIKEANNYVGTIVSASVHPCAFVVSNKDLIDEYGVVKIGDNICVMITSGEADEYRVLKDDFLIVKVWKLISETFELIGKPILGLKDLLDSIKDDQRVWDLFKNGITCTLNQVDSDNGTSQAKRLGIQSFEEGAFLAAAIRPAFDSWRNDFLARKENDTGSKQLNEILSQTHSYILFQENLMQYFEWLGVSPAESIGLIKKISKKKIKPEDFAQLEERLRNNWIKQVGNEDEFQHTWELIQSCMAYGFACPHACATSGDMCYGAYLKVNYPLEYYTVALTNYSDDLPRTNRLIKELDYFNIKLKPIQFRKSKADYMLDKENNTIYKGISSIKFLNEKISYELYDLKDNQYNNFFELLKDIHDKTSVNSKQLTILIKLNFFSEFGNPNQLLEQVNIYDKYAGKKNMSKSKLIDEQIEILSQYAIKVTDKTIKLDSDKDIAVMQAFDNTSNIKTTVKERIAYENELLGMPQITIPKLSNDYYLVNSIDGKYRNKFVKLYRLQDGENINVKVKGAVLDKQSLEEGVIIKVITMEEEHKSIKTSEGWRQSDETETVLKRWVEVQ